MKRHRSVLLACGILAFACLGIFPSARAEAWPVERSWTPEEERAFSLWVQNLGTRARSSVNSFLRDETVNPLHDDRDDEMWLASDCADFPAVLRAYYAWKRGLPYAITVVAGGRYTRSGNTTAAIHDNLSFDGSAEAFLRKIPVWIHSGGYRTVPEATDSLTYPIAINTRSVRPGAVFYDPEGHVGIVVEVTENGDIYLLDAHPDQTVSRIRFSAKLTWRSSARVGGFRAFRPVEVKDGEVVFVSDPKRLPHFSSEQYQLGDYYGTVRTRLAVRRVDPLLALERHIREDVHAEVLDRVRSVELGWARGKDRAIAVPANIYSASGDWENYSTPSRDLRLRRAFHQTVDEVGSSIRLAEEEPERLVVDVVRSPKELGRQLLATKERLFETLTFSYQNSAGLPVTLSLAELERRLYRLSFDPNHPPELRWGAEGEEAATALRNLDRYSRGYDEQQPWRNRLEKKHGTMRASDADNPRVAAPHDFSLLIGELIEAALE